MFGLRPICPHCKHTVPDSASRCPHCKKTIPKKYLEGFRKAENLFWIVFLSGFTLFMIIPLLINDFLGGKITMAAIMTGIPVSLLAAYFVRLRRTPKI